MMAAVLVDEQGALELRAFAAARGGGAWDELRPRISAETARMGGTATEEEGTFGTELVCVVPMQTPDGQQAIAGEPDQRPRGPELAAPRDADGPAGRRAGRRRAPGRRRSGRSSYDAGARRWRPGAPLQLSAAARRPPGRVTVRRRLDVTAALTTLSPCPSTRVACAPRSVAGPTRTARRPASCARTPGRPAWCRSARRPTASGSSSRAPCRTVTLRPRGGVPALEAELYDGSGSISVVWLGRRRIGGIAPGRGIRVVGRIGRPGRPAGDVQPALRPEAPMTAG